jgi:hypothetical protein
VLYVQLLHGVRTEYHRGGTSTLSDTVWMGTVCYMQHACTGSVTKGCAGTGLLLAGRRLLDNTAAPLLHHNFCVLQGVGCLMYCSLPVPAEWGLQLTSRCLNASCRSYMVRDRHPHGWDVHMVPYVSGTHVKKFLRW